MLLRVWRRELLRARRNLLRYAEQKAPGYGLGRMDAMTSFLVDVLVLVNSNAF